MQKNHPTISKKSREYVRKLLQQEFIRRSKKNPSYSMRAFSNFLQMDQSNLTKVLGGQRNLSKKLTLQVYEKLGVDPASMPAVIQRTQNQDQFQNLEDTEFAIISEWYHFAILELLKTKFPVNDTHAVAEKLSITLEEATQAFDRLQSVGLIRKDRIKWRLNSANNSWSSLEKSSEARKVLQKKLLEKGLSAIDKVPFELREHGSLTVAINKKRMPEFKEKLRIFRMEIGDFLQEDGEFDEVYQFTCSLFPLTEISKGNP